MSESIRRGYSVIVPLMIAGTIGLAAGRSAAQTAITTCGQAVQGDAYLVGDLNCPDGTEAAVEIRNGSLDLRGFTISGGEYGVFCARPLGTFAPNGDEFYRYVTCSVSNGTIKDQSVLGVDARELTLTNVTIQESDPALLVAVVAHKRLRVSNVDVQVGPGVLGIFGTGQNKMRLEGSDLTVTGGAIGISWAKKVQVDGLSVTGYELDGLYVRQVDLTGATISGGERGIAAGKVRLTSSTVTGNSVVGVTGIQFKLEGSTITGNALDLQSTKRPKLENTTCDTSNGWGVCAND